MTMLDLFNFLIIPFTYWDDVSIFEFLFEVAYAMILFAFIMRLMKL